MFCEILATRARYSSGCLPGRFIHIGDEPTKDVKITVIAYKGYQFQEKEVASLDECYRFQGYGIGTWINIEGIISLMSSKNSDFAMDSPSGT